MAIAEYLDECRRKRCTFDILQRFCHITRKFMRFSFTNFLQAHRNPRSIGKVIL